MSMLNRRKAGEVAREVLQERSQQDARWGEQNHPDLSNYSATAQDARIYADKAEIWKGVNGNRVQAGRLSWDGILLEEVYEALEQAGKGDLGQLRQELIQVAAVATCWVEALDRRVEPKYVYFSDNPGTFIWRYPIAGGSGEIIGNLSGGREWSPALSDRESWTSNEEVASLPEWAR